MYTERRLINKGFVAYSPGCLTDPERGKTGRSERGVSEPVYVRELRQELTTSAHTRELVHPYHVHFGCILLHLSTFLVETARFSANVTNTWR